MKDFKNVKIGDIAENYSNEILTVFDKGTAYDMFKKYGNKCHMGLIDWLDGGNINDEVIVEKHDPTPLEGTIYTIYLYGDSSAFVKD